MLSGAVLKQIRTYLKNWLAINMKLSSVLNLLINLLSAGYKPRKVIFYDGINEIYSFRQDLSYSFSHSEEKIF